MGLIRDLLTRIKLIIRRLVQISSRAVMRNRYWLAVGSSIILGVIFITTGASKIVDPTEFLTMLGYSALLPLKLQVLVGRWLPWVELVLGLFLVIGISVKFMAGVSSLLVIGFIFQNSWIIELRLETDECGCMGRLAIFEREIQIISSAAVAQYVDIGMMVLSLIILSCYPGNVFTLRPWFLKRR